MVATARSDGAALRPEYTDTIEIHATDTIVMLGDSITADPYVYWQALKDTADGYYGATKPTWVNSGVPSAGMAYADAGITFSASTNYQTYVTTYNPHVLICEVGVNDVASVSFDPAGLVTAYTTFLQNCLAGAPHLSASKIMICSAWLYRGDPSGLWDVQLDQALESIRTVAANIGCRFVDFRTNRPVDGGYVIDGVHPSTKGKAYLCGKMSPRIVML